jgi:hypothetical protein
MLEWAQLSTTKKSTMGEQNECTNWSTVEKMILAAKPWFEEQWKFLDQILRESNAKLSPLCDPLTRLDSCKPSWA